MHFLSYPPPKLTKTFWEHFWGFHFAGQKKSSGRIFSIFASKHEGISRELQTHFGSSLPASFTEKVLGEISRVVHPKTKRFAVKFRRILEVLCLRVLQQKFWAQFHDLCVQERSCLAWHSHAFRKYSACKVYRRSSGRYSTIYMSKNAAVCCGIHTHLWSFPFLSFTKKVLGAFSRSMRQKIKLFAVELRRILGVLCLRVLQKKFLAQFYDLRVQKRSCLLWNWDAFWKFSACKIYRKSSGRNSTICESKNEAVCREIQTHSGSSLPASFTENVLGAIPRFVGQKTKLFSVKFRRILKVLCLQDLQKKFWAQFHDLSPKTKLFAVKFRRILEVLCLQVLKKKLWAQFHDFCVQERSCLPWNSDAFWKFSVREFYEKVVGAIPRFLC